MSVGLTHKCTFPANAADHGCPGYDSSVDTCTCRCHEGDPSNGSDYPEPRQVQFAVITSVERSGNMAPALANVFIKTVSGNLGNDWTDTYEPLGMPALDLYTQVFWPSEILVLDLDGREVAGSGRKPSKWDVSYDTFDNIEDAVKRAQEIANRSNQGATQ